MTAAMPGDDVIVLDPDLDDRVDDLEQDMDGVYDTHLPAIRQWMLDMQCQHGAKFNLLLWGGITLAGFVLSWLFWHWQSFTRHNHMLIDKPYGAQRPKFLDLHPGYFEHRMTDALANRVWIATIVSTLVISAIAMVLVRPRNVSARPDNVADTSEVHVEQPDRTRGTTSSFTQSFRRNYDQARQRTARRPEDVVVPPPPEFMRPSRQMAPPEPPAASPASDAPA